ncbi:MAG: RlmE family RNA methyltransferase [Desulfovibrionaceae bacterium]|nr:RlmE family RNA methyltransferase [Desulfovibrionaceae bacterium]MDD4952729.1 RlmE family RNA methyltransferase [Desulfovibrionaceae bacterium]
MKQYRDHYFKRAKQENYPARSVYKLMELNKRFKLLRPGLKVLDLGAVPGSWTLYAAKKVGPSGRVLAVDLQDLDTALPDNAEFVRADALADDPKLERALDGLGPLDLVLSDMAPKTTGVKFADQARSLELCERARDLAARRLAKGGGLVVKMFEGPDTKAFTDSLRGLFATVKAFKPKSSRSESKETFIAGLGFLNRDG